MEAESMGVGWTSESLDETKQQRDAIAKHAAESLERSGRATIPCTYCSKPGREFTKPWLPKGTIVCPVCLMEVMEELTKMLPPDEDQFVSICLSPLSRQKTEKFKVEPTSPCPARL